jgi:F-type H+-transporting ATPase subunit b
MKVFGRMKKYALASIFIIFFCGMAMASSGGEHEAAPKGWVATDTYRVMNFVVLIGGLIFLLRKPVSQALGARIKSIREQLEDLEAKKKKAEETLSAYNEKFANLDKEAENIIADYVKQGEAAKKKILEEAKVAAEKLQLQASKNVDQEFSQARQVLQQEILEKAVAVAEKIIQEKITSADQDRLVGEYLEKVVAK